MAEQYDVTSVGINPNDDRVHRMRVYFIAMSIRVACVASLFFVRGWWILLVGAGAVLLPYFAVIFANQAAHGGGTQPSRPDPLEISGPEATDPVSTAAGDAVIVVDAPAERRATHPNESRGDLE